MNYISQLTEDEVRFICSVVPYKDTLAYFTKHPKEFAKIRPGFRANAISKLNVSNLLFNYRSRLFISKFIEKRIGVWLSQIQEHISKCLEDGESKDIAFINTLPFCFFADNVNLYFKLVNEEYSEEYIALLSATVKAIKEATNKQERLNEEIKVLESECKKLKTEIESKEAELDRSKDNLSNRLSEINTLNSKISILEELQATAKEDEEVIKSLEREKVEFLDKIHLLSKDLTEVKNNSLLLEKKILTELEEQQKRLEEEQGPAASPKCPYDINEFKEYLGYNLASIGVTNDAEYYPLLIKHLSKTLFHGVPIVVNHAIGINLIKCVGNTLIGKSTVKMMSYSKDVTVEKIGQFLQSADRVVCLDNFIGNFNETELIPLLKKHRDKIVFLTVVYDRTLHYLSNEFKRYCHYFNANRIGALSINTELSEDPSTIAEQSFIPKFALGGNRFQNIFREILRELGYPQSLFEHCCALITNEDDLCCSLAFDVLPYCADVLQINPYTTSERLLKYAGTDGRCPQKKLLMRWFT
ncbi:coiled-coil domain-containing protein [Paenibacillus sp. IITD108]|uniref:coiled-coil domain-containing protein n=1 Tax=Paenibacillus sp. IITD108 TaxID=3116649 RepID=UPI002F407A24